METYSTSTPEPADGKAATVAQALAHPGAVFDPHAPAAPHPDTERAVVTRDEETTAVPE